MKKTFNNTFRTVIPSVKFEFDIDSQSKIMFTGSCFTENIGRVLKRAKLNVDINPFGILYNPVSAETALKLIIEKEFLKDNDLFFFNERWNSFLHHGSYSGADKNETLKRINAQISISHKFLKSCDYLFITFGSAWVYRHIKTDRIVANCHKIPNKEFQKFLLDPSGIISMYTELYCKLKKINPNLKLIFTVSPVRHLKDGFSENSLSKAVLRYSISEIMNSCEDSYYFPAYEIQTDDLRDYRFYDVDLVHPNETAVKYIFDYFSHFFFSEEMKQLILKTEKINKAIEHKPFNTGTKEFQIFIKNTLTEIEDISDKYPHIDLSEESNYLLSFLK